VSARGRFIVLEGLDGAGTTTQGALLAARLLEQGIPVELTKEPTDGVIGVQARAFTDGRTHYEPETVALLFAADRIEHTAAETDRRHRPVIDIARPARPEGLVENDEADGDQIGGDEGFDHLAVDIGKNIGADRAADHPCRRQPRHELPVDIALIGMRRAGGSGREHLRHMRHGAGIGRRHAQRQKARRRQHPESHAERPIDDLRTEAHQHEKEEIERHEIPPKPTFGKQHAGAEKSSG